MRGRWKDLNEGDFQPVVCLDVQHVDLVARDWEASVILNCVVNFDLSFEGDHLWHRPGDVDLICDTVLISGLTRLVEIWLNLLSECARKLLLDKTAGFNDLMYSPVDWTAVRRGGQVPGELLGSDGERKLVGKVDICRSFIILDFDTNLARNSILHGDGNYATWGNPEMSDVSFLPCGAFF